jgi:hypothetical protein
LKKIILTLVLDCHLMTDGLSKENMINLIVV